MHRSFLRFNNVSYTYPGSLSSAVASVSFNLGSGWTAFAGANGLGKTTVLKLASGLLAPDTGSVVSSGHVVYCAQRTDHPPGSLESFFSDWSNIRLREQLRIEDNWQSRWSTLSHGERKRLQIAVALWTEPSVLALDEPFNHLDAHGRSLLIDSMKGFHRCGLLVSHDRHAMDELCSSCVLFFPDGIHLYKTGHSSAVRSSTKQRELLVKRRKEAYSNFHRLKRDARKKMLKARTIQAHASGNSFSFKEICKYGYDGPSRVDGIVQKAGQISREAAARAERAGDLVESIKYRKIHRTGIKLPGTRSTRNFLLDIPPCSIEIGSISVACPNLRIQADSRIALTGRNGAGKTTLLKHIKLRLNCPEEKLIWIPQEITAGQSAQNLSEVKKLSDKVLGQVMITVRRLGSDPKRVLNSAVPSPGESRKLMLARGLAAEPWLVVMDEPTNHMDLPSTECLEKALKDFEGALLLVSHDTVFLSATTFIQWNIDNGILTASE